MRRADGSISVAVRFSRVPELLPDDLLEMVTTWIAERQESGNDPMDDFLALPRVQVRGPALIEVVVDAKQGSRLWRKWLVWLAADIHERKIGYSMIAIIDQVGGGFRFILPAEDEGV